MTIRGSFHAILITSALALSACQGQAPIESSSAAYSARQQMMPGIDILQWQAEDDTHVYILNSARALWYGDGSSWQIVQTNVLWFGVAENSSTIWIRDFSGNLYPWSLGRTVTGVAAGTIAYGTQRAKNSANDGSVFYIGSDGYLYSSGLPGVRLDTNVQSFFPNTYNNVMVIGTDGKLWDEGTTGPSYPWTRSYVDGSALLAQPGCFANDALGDHGTCNSYVLGSDGKLWLESNVTGGHGSTPIDTNVWQFQGTGAQSNNGVFINHRDETLTRHNVADGNADWVDGNVSNFQAVSWDDSVVWVQGSDGNLWREQLTPNLP